MRDPAPNTAEFDELDTVVADYVRAVERGEAPSRADYLEQHPRLADRLMQFFNDFDRMGSNASKFRLPNPGETMTYGDGGPTAELPRVRYLGDYELLSEIARGGMGVVYRARQVSLNRTVALKMILAGTYASEQAVQRFRAEAEAAANLDHPNILPIYEVGEHDGHQYFSMKLVDGGSLAGRIEALSADPRAIAEVVATLAWAVQYAHQRGILHRDLKPANVLLDASGTAYISDFGLARKMDADDGSTRTGSIVGTPSYMAPEQAKAEKGLTTAVDIYSLGAILYELLTGRPPFKGETVFATVKEVIEREPAPPQSLNPAADPDLSVIALKCLEKEPTKRYSSAGELAVDLARWLAGEPILARPVTRRVRFGKWVRRNPTIAMLSAASVLLLLGLLGAVVAGFVSTRQSLKREQLINTDLQETQDQLTKSLAVEKFDRYRQSIQAAQANLAASRADRAVSILSDIAPEFRDWEWHYLMRAARPEIGTVPLPEKSGYYVSADGSTIARRLSSGRIERWATDTGKRKPTPPTEPELIAALSPDGQRYLTTNGTDRHQLKRCDDGTVVATFPIAKRPLLLIGPPGDWVLVCDRESVAKKGIEVRLTRWDVKSDQPTWSKVLPGILHQHMILSDDGASVACVQSIPGLEVFVIDTATGANICHINKGAADLGGMSGVGSFVNPQVAFRPNSQELFCTIDPHPLMTSRTPEIAVFHRTTGKKLRSLPVFTNRIHDFAFDPGGDILVQSGDDGSLMFCSPANGQLLAKRSGVQGYHPQLKFSADGKRVITMPKTSGNLQIWDATQLTESREFVVQGSAMNMVSPTPMAFLPNEPVLFATSFSLFAMNIVNRFNFETGNERSYKRPAETIADMTLLPGAQQFAILATPQPKATFGMEESSEPSQVVVVDASTGKTVRVLGEKFPGGNGLSVSSDGRFLAACRRVVSKAKPPLPDEIELKVWNLSTGAEVLSRPGWGRAVAFHPSRAVLATFDHAANRIVILDVEQNEIQSQWQNADIEVTVWLADPKDDFLAWRPDGDILAVGRRRTWTEMLGFSEAQAKAVQVPLPIGQVTLWETRTGKVTQRLERAYAPFAFPSNGRLVTSADENDSMQLWDVGSGLPVMRLNGPLAGRVVGLAISPDGKRIAGLTTSTPGQVQRRIRIWDASPWSPRFRLEDDSRSNR